jgi:tape measure domain-containing protein
MTTERLIVEISEKGALVVKRNIDEIGKTSRSTDSAVNILKKSLGAIGGAILLKELTSLSDTFTNIQNRIRTVTKSNEELAAVTKRLFEISNSTRSSFEGTAEVYARLAGSSKNLGVSQQQILDTVESINQAVILSGASSQEARAALIQFSQGISAGALRGEELNSVLEQTSVVADVIAKQLGVTRGELRKMGEQGKITATDIFAAFSNSREELAERFAETVPTISQAFTVLRNNVVKLVGEFTTGSGASSAFSDAILFIADNVHRLLDVLNFVGDVAKAVFSQVREGLESFARATGVLGSDVVGSLGSAFKNLGLLILNLVRNIAIYFDKVYGFMTGIVGVIIFTFKKIPGALADIFLQAFNGVVGIVESAINKIIGGINKIREAFGQDLLEDVSFGRVENKFVGDARELGIVARDVFLDAWNQNDLTSFLDGVIDKVTDSVGERAARNLRDAFKIVDLTQAGAPTPRAAEPKKEKVSFSKLFNELKMEGELLKLNNIEREIQGGLLAFEEKLKRSLTDEQRRLVLTQLQENQSLQVQADLLEEIKGPQENLRIQLDALNQLYLDGKINIDEYNKSFKSLTSEFETATVFTTLRDTAISSLFSNATEALGNFRSTWRDFLTSFLQDLARIAAQQALFSLFFQGLGLPKPRGFQHGGSFQVGGSGGSDSQTVAFRATPGEQVTVTPPGQVAPSGGITIVNILDPSEIREAMSSGEGEKVILNIISRNRGIVRQAIA